MDNLFLCDSHAHLTSSDLLHEVANVLQRAEEAGVGTIINICTDEKSLHEGLKLSGKYPWVYNAAGVHPHDAESDHDKFFPIVEENALNGKLVAIGEAGLDYHYNHSHPEKQQESLRQHFRLALKSRLPIIIHCREAFSDFFNILDEEFQLNGTYAQGVLHCFTGTIAEAEQVIARGWYVSISGIVTFKKSIELRDVVRIVPIDKLLIETDAPFLAPQSKRGKPNEPAYVAETAAVVAEVKGMPLEDLIHATTKNAERLFRLV